MPMSNENQDKNLFEELGLSVQFADVNLGDSYPVYGTITKFINESPGNIVVLINDQIETTMNLVEEDKIQVLKNRCFDPGIFVCTITQKDPVLKAECSTVIFGRNNNSVQ
jgi:hypothetical protein